MLNILKLRAKETGNEKVDQLWSVIRHAMTVVGGFLIALGTIKITNGELEDSLNLLSAILDGGYSLYGSILAAYATIAGYFQKEV